VAGEAGGVGEGGEVVLAADGGDLLAVGGDGEALRWKDHERQ
jgi:hypothetical protein